MNAKYLLWPPTLAVASVAHREDISLASPNANAQGNLRISEQNPSVSYRYKYVVAVTDYQQPQQAQQSMSGVFVNARNVLITGGTMVGLSCSYVFDFLTYCMNRMFSLLIPVECRQTSL